MRILAISPGFLPTIGGAEILAHEIYFRLAAKHEVFILTQALKHMPEEITGFDISRYRIIRYKDWLNFGRLPGRMFLRGIVPPFSLGATWAAVQAVKLIQPDVINVHYAIYTGLAAIWAQNISQLPTVLSLIGRDTAPGVQVPLLWPWYANQIAKRVKHTIFISQYCQKYHPEVASTVIPVGVDTQLLKPNKPNYELKQTLNIPPEKRILFSLQRLAPIKRTNLQLQATRVLLESGFTNFILLVGGHGSERAKLEEQARVLGLRQYVHFLGFIPEPDLPAYFSLADLFLMTSANETFGIVLAQALSSGIPVIAFNNSAIPEVIEHGKCGLLAPDGNVQNLVENIILLLSDQILHHQMSRSARLRAENYFDWNQVANQYENVLEAARK